MSRLLVIFFCFIHISSSAHYSETYRENIYLIGKYLFDFLPKHDICELNEVTPEQIRRMIPLLRIDSYFRHKTDDELFSDIIQFINDYDDIPESYLPIETVLISYLYSHESCLLYAFDKSLLTKTIANAFYHGIDVYRDNKIPISYKEMCSKKKYYLCAIDTLNNKSSLDPDYVRNLCRFTKDNIKKLKTNKRGATEEHIYKLVMSDPDLNIFNKKGRMYHVLIKCFINKFAREVRSTMYSCDFPNYDNTLFQQHPVDNLEPEEGQNISNSNTRYIIPDHYEHLQDFVIPFKMSGKKECLDFDEEDEVIENDEEIESDEEKDKEKETEKQKEEEDDEHSFLVDVEENRSKIRFYDGYIVITIIVFIFTLFISIFVFVKKYIQKRRNVHFNLESTELLS